MRSLASSAALTAALLSAHAPALPAQSAQSLARGVDSAAFRSHLEFLASDDLEGRGTGARGGALAARYVATQFARLGLEPAGDSGTWFQRIPLTGRRYTTSLAVGDSLLRQGDDYVAYTDGDSAAVRAEPLFVGYGITAPEEHWDDYAGADARGRIVVALAGTPADQDSSLFRGSKRSTYAYRQYKVDEAFRHGAAAALVVFRPQVLPATWDDIAEAWTGEQLRLDTTGTTSRSETIAGWLNLPAARHLAAAASRDFDELLHAAARPGFRAVSLAVPVALSLEATTRAVPAFNVVARLPGRGPRATQAVLLGAHYDHLGIGRPVQGDSTYNGLIDNASGTAGMLAVAEAFVSSGVRSARSIYFVAFGAEEEGLLGSAALVRRPPVPLDSLAAMVNLDGMNLFADTRDIAALGAELSSLGDVFRAAAAAEGYRISPPDAPLMLEAARQSFFDRSDHASFVRAGVPALFMYFGGDVAGHPGYGPQVFGRYLHTHYHQPSDDLSLVEDLAGGVHQLRVVARTLLAAANDLPMPRWTAASPYQRPGGARAKP
jgi:hypothetical protein